MIPLTIDPELSKLIPPLTRDEYDLLSASIQAEGCREPLIVWGQEGKPPILIDGHNRFRICKEHGIEFELALPFRTFATREDVADWMDKNQLGRRNLSPDDFRLLVGRRYNRLKKAQGRPEKRDQIDPVIPQRTAERIAEEHGISAPTVKRAAKFAEAVDEIEHTPEAETMTRQEVFEAAKRPHVLNNSGNNEWYTPEPILALARKVMGKIDTDPASSEKANETVKAAKYHTAETNGLAQKWTGNVWLNPPYAQPLMAQFAEAVTQKYADGEIKQACILVNNATETTWFQRMLEQATAACLIRSRVKFLDMDGNPSGAPLQGQVVLYMGDRAMAFHKAFSALGCVLERVR